YHSSYFYFTINSHSSFLNLNQLLYSYLLPEATQRRTPDIEEEEHEEDEEEEAEKELYISKVTTANERSPNENAAYGSKTIRKTIPSKKQTDPVPGKGGCGPNNAFSDHRLHSIGHSGKLQFRHRPSRSALKILAYLVHTVFFMDKI
ncbi:hypothetical protein AHF37_11857, partial [Paragonimus kellicotti]